MELTPVQQRAYQAVLRGLEIGKVVSLSGRSGTGVTTLLRRIHAEQGGVYLSFHSFLDEHSGSHPLSLEESFDRMVREALRSHPLVIVDDVSGLDSVVGGHCHFYPRSNFVTGVYGTLAKYAEAMGKQVLFGFQRVPDPLDDIGFRFHIPEFEPEDYAALCRAYLPEAVWQRLEFRKIHRFASHLNAYHLRNACLWVADHADLDTEGFVDYLRSQHLSSNVDLAEVQQVDLATLKGVDDIIRSLEANIVLPLENESLAEELDLQPKRGVLLAGPPGTGKTTIGRALAHRLKGKFFLVDGTFISGTDQFYNAVHRVFEAAKENAPSVIFIDDSDVIFESGEESGLYRYLLTMLDGLESESVGEVCVMLTAMDVGNLPPALLRSGRVELWLEMRLPDTEARLAILQNHLAGARGLHGIDAERLAEATDGFTGADLKRLVSDGKLLLAYDRVKGHPEQPVTDYFLQAVEGVRVNKARYADAEARARRGRPTRPPWFNPMVGMGLDGEDGEDA